jgi:hypothetical protein
LISLGAEYVGVLIAADADFAIFNINFVTGYSFIGSYNYLA